MAGDTLQEGGPSASPDATCKSQDFEIKNLVDLYLHQSSSVNQLWTTYVVATFAGGTFAITAGNEGGVLLLYSGAIGFSAFTFGHILLVRSGLDRMKLAAEDIKDSLKNPLLPRALHLLAKPIIRWPSFTCHIIIDACVIGAFIYRIATWTPPLP